MIKKCVVCGTEFDARQANYCICSDECRHIRQYEQNKRYKSNNREKYLYLTRQSWLRRKKSIHCKICGKVVLQHIHNGHMTSKHYHEDCIVNEGIQAIKENAKSTDNRLVRAHNRYGYSMLDLREIMNDGSTV